MTLQILSPSPLTSIKSPTFQSSKGFNSRKRWGGWTLSSFCCDSTNVPPNECISVFCIRVGILHSNSYKEDENSKALWILYWNAGKCVYFVHFFLCYLNATLKQSYLIHSVDPTLDATGRYEKVMRSKACPFGHPCTLHLKCTHCDLVCY